MIDDQLFTRASVCGEYHISIFVHLEAARRRIITQPGHSIHLSIQSAPPSDTTTISVLQNQR
jgi:hypothetical protein